MQIFIYIISFITGTVFGSFFTLAVHRLPLKQDITHERSYCPKCNHRLEFLDLIPVLSYIFLGGKCRYCKESIKKRYLFLEIGSGLVFLLTSISININIYLGIAACILLPIIYRFSMLILVDKKGNLEKQKKAMNTILLILFISNLSINIFFHFILNMWVDKI